MSTTLRLSEELLKNHRLHKFFFAFLTFYLLCDEFHVFLVEKPTYSSSTKTIIEPSDFPTITICAYPGFNYRELENHGYEQAYKYPIGDIEGTNQIGWIGNTTNSTYEIVADKISTIKSVKDCPSTKAFVEDKAGKMKGSSVLYELTNPLHPNGQCCRSIIPYNQSDRFIHRNDLLSFRLVALNFRVKLSEHRTQVKGFSMFLTSREATTDFHMDKFSIEGVELKASSSNLGYALYDLQIYKKFYIGRLQL